MEYGDNLIKQVIDFDSDRSSKWEKDRKPYAAIFELTARCNMNCIHCYLKNHHLHSELSTQRVIEILDILYEHNILFLTFTGGEILTRKDFSDIYEYAKKKGFLVELFTNAYLLDDKTLELLKKYPPLLVDVSLYGGCEETYTKITGITGAYQRVVDNCRRVKASNIRIALKSPIMRETYNDLPLMRELGVNLGIVFRPSFEIVPTIDGNLETKEHQLSAKEILEYEFNEHEKKAQSEEATNLENYVETYDFPYVYDCKIGISSFVIDYKGNMCPCMKLRHHGVRLTNENFNDLWNSFGKYRRLKLPQGNKCRKCRIRNYCEVCPAEREYIKGDVLWRYAADCKYAQARADYYLKHISIEEIIANLG